MDIFGMINFFTNLLTGAMGLVGAAFALMGLGALGWGLWDVIQHFKPENRDNPDQKSRLTSGIVKFIAGGILATGGYQVIANKSFSQGGVQQGAATSKVQSLDATDQIAMHHVGGVEAWAAQHGLTVAGA